MILQGLPPEILHQIFHLLQPKSWDALSLINQQLNSLFDGIRPELNITVPLSEMKIFKSSYIEQNPQIFVTLLKRFPNIKKLSFNKDGVFNEHYQVIYNFFIEHLKENYPKHLTVLSLSDIRESHLSEHTRGGEELNTLFFMGLSRPQISKVTYLPCNGCTLTKKNLNAILNNMPNLKSFSFDGFGFKMTDEILFSNPLSLQKVKICRTQAIGKATIESIRQCINLKKLSLEGTFSLGSRKKLEFFLSKTENLQITHLNLAQTPCLKDDETLIHALTNLPQLTFFASHMLDDYKVNDKGLIKLSVNCRNLTTVFFNFVNITDDGLKEFARNATNLQKLSAYQCSHITSAGMEALTTYCTNLKGLELIQFHDINRSFISSVQKNCTQLQLLRLENCSGTMSLKELETFIQTTQTLKYLDVASFSLFKRNQFDMLHNKFSKLEKLKLPFEKFPTS